MSRQFDVHLAAYGNDKRGRAFLVNLQSDHLDRLRTVVATPMWPVASTRPSSPVSIRISVEGRHYWLAINEMAFVRVSALGRVVGNIADERDRIVQALDLLFAGV